MNYGDFKDLSKEATAYNVLLDKAFNSAKDPKYVEYQRGPESMIYKFFDKNYSSVYTSDNGVKNENTSNQ